jgi:hypothetical protein
MSNIVLIFSTKFSTILSIDSTGRGTVCSIYSPLGDTFVMILLHTITYNLDNVGKNFSLVLLWNFDKNVVAKL